LDEEDEEDDEEDDEEEDDEEEEERRRRWGGEEEQATDIKSNNPHLAGGEKTPIPPWLMIYKIKKYINPPKTPKKHECL
jgi:hypothetical protein